MPNEPVPAELQKLRDLREKIQKLMKEADVAGLINLQGKDYAEWAMIIDPSWSLLRWEHHGGDVGIRFRCKFKSGSPEEKEMGRLTVGMVNGMLKVAETHHDQLDRLRAVIASKLNATSTFDSLPQV